MSYSNHGQVIGAFNREFLKPGVVPKNYAREIQTLFDDRQSADYDIMSPIGKAITRAEIAMAEGILECVMGFEIRISVGRCQSPKDALSTRWLFRYNSSGQISMPPIHSTVNPLTRTVLNTAGLRSGEKKSSSRYGATSKIRSSPSSKRSRKRWFSKGRTQTGEGEEAGIIPSP